MHSLHTLIERVEGDMTVCHDKDVLAHVSNCSESLDEDDTLPPLGFPTSPPPVPTSITPVSPPVTTSLSAFPRPVPTTSIPLPRHSKNPSALSHSATLTNPTVPKRPTLKSSSDKSSSPSYTPPHSASSSPGQTYARPPYIHHKKAESTSVLPLRSPHISDLHVSGGPRRPESRSRGRAGPHMPHHGPSPSLGSGTVSSPPPGWI